MSTKPIADNILCGMGCLGRLLFYGGILGAIFFFTAFDTTVEIPTSEIGGQTIGGGRVNNIGLMADRQNGILISMGAAILGAVFIVASPKGDTMLPCPWCSQSIPADSKACRYCGKPVEWVSK